MGTVSLTTLYLTTLALTYMHHYLHTYFYKRMKNLCKKLYTLCLIYVVQIEGCQRHTRLGANLACMIAGPYFPWFGLRFEHSK